jgi:tripartite-type tricarboxylate transporter receptor subunit TctC
MKLTRRTITAVSLAVAATWFAGSSKAQSGPIKIVVPFAPGGATDALARILAPHLAASLGQTVIVENRPGAGGQIGTAGVKAGPADGTVFLFTPDHTIVTIPHLVDKAGYESVRDFVAVGQVARFPLALAVGPATGAKGLSEFVAYAKSHPEQASYGVPVVGGFPSTVGVALSKRIGVQLIAVPFQGSGPAVMNAAGGQVAASITGLADAIPLAQSGKVRIVAITGARRSPTLPDVPTFEELGYPGLSANSWYAFFAPKSLPKGKAEAFNQALLKAMESDDVRRRIADLSIEAAPTNLADSDSEFKAAAAFWAAAAKSPDFVRP